MNCEYCGKECNSSFGSGRFCSKGCACGFSTKIKRKEINEKVSKSLSNRPSWNNAGFKIGYDERRHIFTNDDRIIALISIKNKNEEKDRITPFHKRSKYKKRLIILEEQNNRCKECGLEEWNGKNIIIEIHHIDGNKKNNLRENLCGLCPNCHSQTNNFRNSKRK